MFCFVAFLIVFVFFYVSKGLFVVGPDEEIVVERNRRFFKVFGAGVHFLIPVIDKIRGIEDPLKPKAQINKGRISKKTITLEFPTDGRCFYSLVQEQFYIKVDVAFKIIDSYKAVYGVAYLFDTLNQLVCGFIQNRILGYPNDANMKDVLKNIESNLPEAATKYCAEWGVKIENVKIKQYIDEKGIRHNL